MEMNNFVLLNQEQKKKKWLYYYSQSRRVILLLACQCLLPLLLFTSTLYPLFECGFNSADPGVLVSWKIGCVPLSNHTSITFCGVLPGKGNAIIDVSVVVQCCLGHACNNGIMATSWQQDVNVFKVPVIQNV